MQLNAEIQMSILKKENAGFLFVCFFIYRKVTVLPIFSPRQKGAADLETPLCWCSDLYLDRNTWHSISSLPFQLVLTENNFNTVSRKMVNGTLQWKYRPHF